MVENEKRNEEFLQWLSPSFDAVEAQLDALRVRRGDDTLKWAPNMSEFREWHCPPQSDGLSHRLSSTLWIQGAAGVGKSTMAGYLIDFLTVLYPDSCVAYFFCLNGRTGLKTARDIVRTLAYQFFYRNDDALLVLEKARKEGFRIEQPVGIRHLVNKVLQKPLQHVDKDIYIIIDGLDEADELTLDVVETRPQRRELDVLLECLTCLPGVRVLFISRAWGDVRNASIPRLTVKPLTFTDNFRDIQTYIKRTIDDSPRLQRQFEKVQIGDPVQYILKQADGVFLWAVLALDQLSEAESKGAFLHHLEEFARDSGHAVMDVLYTTALSKFTGEGRRWLQKSLQWLVVAERVLTIEELKAFVEWSLDYDEHDDFYGFIQNQCGAILQVTEVNNKINVQLIHGTFRTFLLNPGKAGDYFIDKELAHGVATFGCLRLLSNEDKNSVHLYAAEYWTGHLTATPTMHQRYDQALELLMCLEEFVHSSGIIIGFKYRVLEGFNMERVYHAVDSIYVWLEMYQNWDMLLSGQSATYRGPVWSAGFKKATAWMEQIMEARTLLEDDIGKTVAREWLYGDLEFDKVLKYYLLSCYCRDGGPGTTQTLSLLIQTCRTPRLPFPPYSCPYPCPITMITRNCIQVSKSRGPHLSLTSALMTKGFLVSELTSLSRGLILQSWK